MLHAMYWAVLAAAFLLTRNVPLPAWHLYLVLSVGAPFFIPGPPGTLAACWLVALLTARLGMCLEAYTLATFWPPWEYGSAAYWPLVGLSASFSLLVWGLAGGGDLLYLRRYANVFLAAFSLFSLLFSACYRRRLYRPMSYAAAVAAFMLLPAAGSLAWLRGLRPECWQSWDRALWALSAAGIAGITGAIRWLQRAAPGGPDRSLFS